MILNEIDQKSINFDGPHQFKSIQIRIDMLDKFVTEVYPNSHECNITATDSFALRVMYFELFAGDYVQAPCVGSHITLGGGFHTSQISQETLGNLENP